MRIAYVCADRGVPIFGNKGCSIHVREVISALVARGAQIDLFAARLDGERPVGWQNVRIHTLPLLFSTDPGEREQMALASNEQITAALRKTGPFDMIYERYSLWSYAAMEYARLSGTTGVLEVNAPLIEEQAQYRGLIDRAGAERVAHRAFGAATALLSVEATAEGLAVHQMAGFDPEKARQLFGIPAGWEAIAAIALGYPGDPASLPPPLQDREMAPRTRKPMAEFVMAGQWGHTAPFATK